MHEHKTTPTRPPVESLACIDQRCELYGQKGRGNLTVRKVYGKDEIRFLRCSCCGAEFSERKNTALWNTKVSEARAEAVAERVLIESNGTAGQGGFQRGAAAEATSGRAWRSVPRRAGEGVEGQSVGRR